MAEVTYADLVRALDDRDPQFVELALSYLAQPDPPETGPEDEDESPGQRPPLPEGTWTMGKLRAAVAPPTLVDKSASERKAARKEAWEGIAEAPHHPPRLDLGDRFIALYESGDVWARESLMQIFKSARLGWGVWRAFKKIYKLAEERHDAAMFGVLAYRLDAWSSLPTTGEVMPGTVTYMRRRPWRYLRQLGRAVPDLYPQFASQVLEHYPKHFQFYDSVAAMHIMADSGGRLETRAFHEAWKIVPEPLLRLLEDAENDQVTNFAIRSLKADFPEKLRKVDAEWLARIGKKPLASVHNFIVGVLEDSPELHQSKLRGLGLHEMVLGFLGSDSDKARTYAIEYARAHAADMPVSDLVELAAEGAKEVRAFAIDRLSKQSASQIGLPSLLRLIGVSEAAAMAEEKLKLGFSPEQLTEEHFITLSVGNPAQRKFVTAFFKNASKQIPAKFYTALLDDKRCDWMARREALEELGKRTGKEIGAEWLKKALMDPQLQYMITNWLRAGKLSGPDLDVEWVKGLVMRPSLRSLAIDILKNRAWDPLESTCRHASLSIL